MGGIPDLTSEENNNNISVITDPFVEDALSDINIYFRAKPMFNGKPYWYASVQFKNGFSEGKQQTPHCDTYPEMMVHLQNILKSVKKDEPPE